MKIFFAIPYSQLCDENYEVKKEYRDFLEKLTSKTKEMGCDYFLAHEREKWGKQYNSAEESTVIDFETIKKSDMLCVIPGVPNSGGVHVEMGWASANKVKKGKGKDLEGPYAQYFIYYDDTAWTFEEYDNADNVAAFVIGQILWSNYDIVNTDDGTIYLAASVPVPVTETDHNARIMGWIVGKRLAA